MPPRIAIRALSGGAVLKEHFLIEKEDLHSYLTDILTAKQPISGFVLERDRERLFFTIDGQVSDSSVLHNPLGVLGTIPARSPLSAHVRKWCDSANVTDDQ